MSQLTQYLPLALLVIGVLAILVLIYLVLLLLRTGSSAETSEAYDEPPPPPPDEADAEEANEAVEVARPELLRGLERSFRRARKQLDSNIAGPQPRYSLPWYLVMGGVGSHRPDLFRRSGLSLPFGPPDADAMALEGAAWWFFDGGVMLDVTGEWVLDRSGASSDEKGWRHLLDQFQKHRPKKPLDGIVLALKGGDLLAAARDGAEGLNRLEQQAAHVYRKLWQLQKQLELRFPIYILITDCQDIPGFHSVCLELPEALGDEIFGWSSPYTVDTAYRESWVGEAFGSLTRRLTHVQTEIFATRPEIADPDGVFLFPDAMGQLEEPLRVYLSQLFKPSAYHESILFRGLYFSGTDELPFHRREQSQRPRTYFVRQLLEQKIFPEAALCRPTAEALVGRNRRVRIAQIALIVLALFLGAGVWMTWQTRHHSRLIFDRELEEIAADLNSIRSGRFDAEQSRSHTIELSEGMAAIDTDHFATFFFPVSWFSRFDDRLKDALTVAFEEIIFESIHLEIGRRARELAQYDPYRREFGAPDRESETRGWDEETNPFETGLGGAPDSSAYTLARVCSEVVPLADLPEFRALDTYLEDLAGLEHTLDILHRLPTSNRQLRDLGEVIGYVFEISLDEDFYQNSQLYEVALRKAIGKNQGQSQKALRTRLLPPEFDQQARDQIKNLTSSVQRELFSRNALIRSLDDLASSLDRLAGGDYDFSTRQPFRQVVDAMLCTEDVLSHPQLDWIFRPRPDIGPELDALIETVRDSSILNPPPPPGDTSPDFPSQLREEFDNGWRLLRRALVESRSEVVGRHLENERDLDTGQRVPLRRLSGDASTLQLALQEFIGQSFMGADEVRHLRSIRPGDRLIWDTLLLERAVELEAPYERFRSRNLPYFPEELRTSLERVARNQMSQRILTLVARAQRFEPLPQRSSPLLVEPEVQAEIAGYQAASEYLHRLLGLFDRLNLRQDYNELAEILADQGVRLLRQVETMRQDERLYQPLGGGFDWWRGDRPPNLPAFQVQDPDELEVYLERQRNRIQHLAVDYSAPLITSLAKVGIENDAEHRTLYRGWEAILAELKAYESKSPGNSVSALEEMIRGQMAELGLADCGAIRASGGSAGTPRDFFLDRRNRMGQQLYDRCQKLAFDRAVACYDKSATLFNARLARRFPFTNELPGKFDNEVDPEDLRTFFAGFGAYADYFSEVPVALRNDQTEAVSTFVDQMRGVRDFFAPYLKAEGDPLPPPIFDFDVEFRTNRCSEVGGDQIIDWQLEVGGTTIGHRDAEHVGRWQLGVPVRLRLRWARDALRLPAVTAPKRGIWIRDDQVTFEYDHDWSLLGLMIGQRAEESDFKAECPGLPNTLELTVPTRPFDKPADTASGELDPLDVRETRVFVRLTPLEPESSDPLTLPELFPRRAPALPPGERAECPGESP